MWEHLPLNLLLRKQTFGAYLQITHLYLKVCPLAGCFLRRAGRVCQALTWTDDIAVHTFIWLIQSTLIDNQSTVKKMEMNVAVCAFRRYVKGPLSLNLRRATGHTR